MITGSHDEHGDEHRRHLENSESDTAWKFGVSLMGGYFIPFIFSGIFPHSHVPKDDDIHLNHKQEETAILKSSAQAEAVEYTDDDTGKRVVATGSTKDDIELRSEEEHTDVGTEKKVVAIRPDYRLATAVLVGDFFHNFADGIFIGTAFLLCSTTIAITVTATSVFHELSQELADYFLLTNQCGFSPCKALTLNFISGMSVMLGVIVIMAVDVSSESVGVLLAMSAGVYLFVSLTECAPRVNHYLVDNRSRVLSFLFWTVGAVPIGLVLLNHEHCG